MGDKVLRGLWLSGLLLITSCAAPVDLPKTNTLKAAATNTSVQFSATADPNFKAPVLDLNALRAIPQLAAGKKVIYGFVVSEALYLGQTAVNQGDIDGGLEHLSAAKRQAATPFERLYIEMYRNHALNLYGRAPEVESQIAEFQKQEMAFHNTNLMALTLLGDAQYRLGDTNRSVANFKKVLKAMGPWRFPTSYSGPPTNMSQLAWMTEIRARATLGLALAETLRGNYAEAKIWAQKCESHMADVLQVKDHPIYGSVIGDIHPDVFLGRGVALALLGAASIHENRSATAGDAYLRAARTSFRVINFRPAEAFITVFKAKALVDAGLNDAALIAANDALRHAKAMGLHDFIWRIEYLKGRALLSEGRLSQAEDAFRVAQNAVDAITGILGRDSEKRRFGVGKQDVTYQLTRLAFKRKDANVLFTDLERGRARAFVDMMTNVPSFGGALSQDVSAIRAQDRNIQRRSNLQTLQRTGKRAIIATDNISTGATTGGVEVVRSTASIQDCQKIEPEFDEKLIMGDGGAYEQESSYLRQVELQIMRDAFNKKRKEKIARCKEAAQQAVTKPVVQPTAVTPDGKRAIVTTDDEAPSGGFQSATLQRRQAVERIARRNPDLASMLEVRSESLDKVRAALGPRDRLVYFLPYKSADRLTRVVIGKTTADFEELAATGKEVGLALLKFRKAVKMEIAKDQNITAAALGKVLEISSFKGADNIYIVASGAVHLVPWGALAVDQPIMVLPTGSWLGQKTASSANDKVVVIGDPDYSGKLPQLPGALAEAKMVAGLYGARPIIGRAATESSVRQATRNGAKILHLATHGQFNARAPLQSRIILSKPGGYESVTAQELFQNPIPGKVVILSACETGIGQVNVGDDFLGLPRSFYLGGTSTIISSLWQVDDAGTALFMETFHKRVAAGKDYGLAWLAARDAVKKAGMPPWIYGAFVIGGKTR